MRKFNQKPINRLQHQSITDKLLYQICPFIQFYAALFSHLLSSFISDKTRDKIWSSRENGTRCGQPVQENDNKLTTLWGTRTIKETQHRKSDNCLWLHKKRNVKSCWRNAITEDTFAQEKYDNVKHCSFHRNSTCNFSWELNIIKNKKMFWRNRIISLRMWYNRFKNLSRAPC